MKKGGGLQTVAISALLLALSLASPVRALAEDATSVSPAPAATQPSRATEHLQELDEITVHGKRLSQQITDAEDDFYRLYNQVEQDGRYRTSCVYLNTDPDRPDSQIKTRACIPGFVADAMADWAVWKSRCQPPMQGFDEFDCLDRNHDRRLSWDEAGARLELASQFMTMDRDHDGYLSRQEFSARSGASPPPGYQPPPPQLVLAEGSADWYKHMTQVVNSDPRLLKMADHLGGLYHELAAVQGEYGKAREALDQDRPQRAVKANLGPRVH